MTEKDSEGFWVKTFNAAPINFILNDGTGADSGKTPDITGVSGDVYYEYDGATTATATTGGGGGQTGGTTTIHVKAASAPTLYAWTDAGELNGGWPGTQMTEKDSEGFWVKTFNAAPINFILNDRHSMLGRMQENSTADGPAQQCHLPPTCLQAQWHTCSQLMVHGT